METASLSWRFCQSSLEKGLDGAKSCPASIVAVRLGRGYDGVVPPVPPAAVPTDSTSITFRANPPTGVHR